MIKKIVLISLFVLFGALLIGGGIYRTNARSANELRVAGEELALGSLDSELHNNAGEELHSGKGQGEDQGQGQGGGERQGQGLGNSGQPQGRNQKSEESSGTGSQGEGYQGSGGQGQGQGQGQGRSAAEGWEEGTSGGGGRGQGRGAAEGRSANEAEMQEAVVIGGTIMQAPAAGVDMILATDGGEELLVGTGPGWLQEQGFTLVEGEKVQVSGFWEEDEFKAVTITRLSDGKAIALRDEYGRPRWSGAGRRNQPVS